MRIGLVCRLSQNASTLPLRRSTPHPSLTYYAHFLSPEDQQYLLGRSLKLLSSPSHTSSSARQKSKRWLKGNPSFRELESGFMDDQAYEFEDRHFDGVIEGYREMVVRNGMWGNDERLRGIMQRLYDLVPKPSTSMTEKESPPSHVLLHILHLSSKGAIYPHVDNLEASGPTIVGLSLGGERVMKFKKVREGSSGTNVPDEFDVLLEPGSVYVQKDPLRTEYTHELPRMAVWDGQEVGGSQRLSLMLRDKLS